MFAFAARLKGGFVGLGGCSHPYASDLADGIYIEQGDVNPLKSPNPPSVPEAGIFRCPSAGPATAAQAKGVLPARIAMRGARAQHCATVRPESKVCRVCGSHPAVRASGANAQSAWACTESCVGQTVQTWVRTGFAGLHLGRTKKTPGKKTQCWRGVAADSPPGLQKSVHQRYEHRLTHRTQVDETSREARTRARA